MRAVDILRKKRDGLVLDRTEIEDFIEGVTARTWPDYQTSALLMAILLRGFSAEETADLTAAMARSGARLDLSDIPGPKVDKHSTGGVGDKTSLVLAPLGAACGVVVPMMSGRGLGHTGGTLDKLEAIPGFRVNLSLDEFRSALRAVGCAMIGQTSEIAPADKILYALRDVTATVEGIPLITASIMSKKIAEGIDSLVLDVKCGRGAFMKTGADAEALAESLVRTGNTNGVRTQALLTAMNAPLGRAVGNALEVRECLETLRGRGPADVEKLSVSLAARMVYLGSLVQSQDSAEARGTALLSRPILRTAQESRPTPPLNEVGALGPWGDAGTRVRQALTSGQGLEKLRQIIERQGGNASVVDNPRLLPAAPHQTLVRAGRPGYVIGVDAEKVGHAVMLLGAGRHRTEDTIDPSVGVILKAVTGEQVADGAVLAEVHYRRTEHLSEAVRLLEGAWQMGDAPPPAMPLILGTMGE